MTTRYVLAGAAILILLAVALTALLGDRSGVARPSPTPSATPTSSPAETPTSRPTATGATSPSPTA